MATRRSLSRGARLPGPSEASASPGSNPLDWTFADLEKKVQEECSDIRCRQTHRTGLTDNARVSCRVVVRRMGVEVREASVATPRQLLNYNLDQRNWSRQLQLDVLCGHCGCVAATVLASKTAELLYVRLSEMVTHNTWLPLLYFPGDPQRNRGIPDDAKDVCLLAHEFDAAHLTPRIIDRISSSLRGGDLRECLKAKMEAKPPGDRHLTYLRIGVGVSRLGDKDTPILELWPVGHRSPKHQHGGCAGSVRVLHGKLNVKLYKSLWDPEAMRFKAGDGGLDLEPGEYSELLLKADDTTWLNRSNWFVHEVSCLQEHEENCDGFALSLHIYKSCTDEFEFLDNQVKEAKKGNPENDYFWNLDLSRDDPRLTDAMRRPDFEDAIAARPAAEAGWPKTPTRPQGRRHPATGSAGSAARRRPNRSREADGPKRPPDVEGRAPAQAGSSRQGSVGAGSDRPAGPSRAPDLEEVIGSLAAQVACCKLWVAPRGCLAFLDKLGRPADPAAPTELPKDAFLVPGHAAEADIVRQGGAAAGHGRSAGLLAYMRTCGRRTEPVAAPGSLEAEVARPAGATAEGDGRHAPDDVLDLSGRPELTDSDVEREVHARGRSLRAADFSGCRRLTDKVAECLAAQCKQLQSARFWGCPQMSDAAARHLAGGCAELRVVDFTFCPRMTDAAGRHLAEGCGQLQIAFLVGCPQVTRGAARESGPSIVIG